jgi:hypothetical protein
LFPQNSYCGSSEKALSVFDTRNRFVTSLLYELPFGRGKRFLNAGGIVNQVLGWNISSIITIQPNGFPLTVMDGDISNVGAGFDRPNANGTATQLSRGSRNVFQWFNTGAYCATAGLHLRQCGAQHRHRTGHRGMGVLHAERLALHGIQIPAVPLRSVQFPEPSQLVGDRG